MFSLLYCSTATANLNDAGLTRLAEGAARFNAQRNVTGLLVFNGKNFMQVLEGSEEDVREVMDRIAADPGHRDIIYLRTEPRRARECPNWSMHAIVTPLAGAGASTQFAHKLPLSMDIDTRMLFSSFASALRPQELG
ncbi:BLUF domain-containing protein [Altererythrobacter lauratis]|uniref:BLUF domain-containing protein n=1 Tax=Alteraurantiacibacter lauratis TaxID=2054627 RepID=A0ABV7EGU7_9SPHN